MWWPVSVVGWKIWLISRHPMLSSSSTPAKNRQLLSVFHRSGGHSRFGGDDYPPASTTTNQWATHKTSRWNWPSKARSTGWRQLSTRETWTSCSIRQREERLFWIKDDLKWEKSAMRERWMPRLTPLSPTDRKQWLALKTGSPMINWPLTQFGRCTWGHRPKPGRLFK